MQTREPKRCIGDGRRRTMNSKEYTLPNGKKAVFEYDVCGIGKVTLDCMDELMGMIADRPQEWIPCSERLPKKYEQVLCCNKDGRVFSTALTYVHPAYKYWYFGKHRSVIAWMPLPKPWKGADDE